MKKVLLTGGNGLLGRKLTELCPEIIAPPREECELEIKGSVDQAIGKYQPDILIHAAAMTNNRLVESDPARAIASNIIGSAHVAIACLKSGIRLVYVSTDYVYRGNRERYKEDDEIYPFNFYAWTKLGGESAVRACPDHLIIRTSFGDDAFEHPAAFIDKWSSKDTVSTIAPMIWEAALSDLKGIVNIGTARKTVYEYATKCAGGKDIRPIRVVESSHPTPVDTSLDLTRWLKFLDDKKKAGIK